MGRKDRPPRTTSLPGLGQVVALALVVAIAGVVAGFFAANARVEFEMAAADPPPSSSPAPLRDEARTAPSPTVTPTPTSTPTPTPAPTPSPTPTPTPAATPAPAVEIPVPPRRAAFIGDSYTQGGGAESHAHRWSTLVSADLGWIEENFGRGGTGFVTANSYLGCGLQYCPTYVEMVAEVVAAAPDIVVVAGGQNDFEAFAYDPDGVRAAIAETYRSLRGGLPGATIVAVGPSTPWQIDDIAWQVDAAVREAAASVGAVYISMLEPNVIDPAHALGDGHVGNAGHRAIADRIVSALAD